MERLCRGEEYEEDIILFALACTTTYLRKRSPGILRRQRCGEARGSVKGDQHSKMAVGWSFPPANLFA